MGTLTAPSIRSSLSARMSAARQETDRLFSIIVPASLYDRPIPERHRIVFYIGHLEAFDWNLLRDHLGLKSFDARLDQLFAFGIDPVDGGLPTDTPADWPTIAEVESYRDRIRNTLDAALDQPSGFSENLLHIAVEHRLMHAETLEYMFHQLPFESKIAPQAESSLEVALVTPMMLPIPAGMATLGLRHDAGLFGWDNEFEQHQVQVPSFSIDRYKVTNGDFAEFLNAGGYHDRSFWTDAGWHWITSSGITHPVFWVRNETGWHYRTMFNEIPLPLDWPVYVSHAEASAYARWSGKALPSEAEWHRAAYGTGQQIEREFPWGSEPPKETRRQWNPPASGSSPDLASAFAIEDLLATGWEWTSTEFAPFPGFQITPEYPGYSANFFDGQHYVMKGGSTRTDASMLRRTFRNWFQPHYQYVYAGFRCVSR